MGQEDYYSVLGLQRKATTEQIHEAYRWLALKHHPDRQPPARPNDNDDSSTGQDRFEAISTAYQVLCQAEAKAAYDSGGERELREWAEGGEGAEQRLSLTPQQVFDKFFGTSNPFQALADYSGKFQDMAAPPALAPGKEKTFDLPCTLKELYFGCTKRVLNKRTVESADGQIEERASILLIQVPRGARAGTRFVFRNEGDQPRNCLPGAAVYVVSELDHPRFRRRGDDLEYTARVGLVHALCATAVVDVETLDGRKLSCPIPNVIHPGFTKLIPNEGMPIPLTDSNTTPQSGSLLIVFHIIFPPRPPPSSLHHRALAAALALPPRPAPAQEKAAGEWVRAYEAENGGWKG